MTRLIPTGGDPDDFETLDLDPRRLAQDVPRHGEQRDSGFTGEDVDEHDDGVPTRPVRTYDDNGSISRVERHKPRRRSRSVW